MRRKIFLFLLVLFLLFAGGAGFAILSIRNTTTSLNRLMALHEIEDLHQNLITSARIVQSDLSTLNPQIKRQVDDVSENVERLQRAARECSGCHHNPEVAALIGAVQARVATYERSLNRYLSGPTGSSARARSKADAAAVGKDVLKRSQTLATSAVTRLGAVTREAMQRARFVWIVLIGTLVLIFIVGAAAALKLAASITRPVEQLASATRAITAGQLGYTIDMKDRTELGELAAHFNSMSKALKSSYAELKGEIAERRQAESALLKSEAFLNTIFDSIRDPFCIIDRSYRIVRANDAYAELKGRKLGELIGAVCFESLRGRTDICDECIVRETFVSADAAAKEKQVTSAGGISTWHEIYTYPIIADGSVSHVIEYTRDITERKRAEDGLRESEERYAVAARGANDGLWDWDLRNNTIYYSYRWKSMLGFENTEIGKRPEEWFGRVHPDDRAELEARIAAHIDGRSPHFECDYRIMHRDGTYRWMLGRGLAVRGEQGASTRIAGSQTDITERKRIEEQLVYDAFHDALTGLPNRALFMNRLEHVIARSHRETSNIYAVLFLDVDRFKVINDSLGHTAGDELLVHAARKLADCLRPGDSIARFGGDEFAVLLEGIRELKDAVDIADRIHQQLSAPLLVSGNELFITVSIGIAVGDQSYERPEQVLRDADIAMYQAKARGKGSHEVFEPRMHASILERIQLESDLRNAIERGEFVVHYQPIVDLDNRGLIGFEALVRWNHPTRGIIGPLEFIPLAEENGLINRLGEWIFRQSCRQLAQWQSQYRRTPPLRMSINISGRQFSQLDLPDRLHAILLAEGLSADSLALEITESMIMDNLDRAASTMRRLREMGFQIHIDDFGTGYSSLSYLHQFPVTALKIDRSFVSKLTSSGENKEIITSIVSLANSLNLKVIAEGVEMTHQLNHVKDLHCQYGQGFFFSRPMDPGKIDEWIRSGSVHV